MKKGNPVLQRLQPNVSRPSTPFDRGHRSNFTMNAGQLIPLFNKFVPAGTKFKINRSVFLRTNAVNTAAFSEMNFCIDFYKVPIKLLVSNWGAIQTMTRDVNSVLMQQSNGSFSTIIPKVKTEDIEFIWNSPWPYTDRDSSTSLKGKCDTARLFDYFNTGWVDWSRKVDEVNNFPAFHNNDIAQNLLNFCAYQKIYFDHYRNTLYEKNDAWAYNIDDIVNAGTWPTTSNVLKVRLSKIMQLRYVNMRNDFFGNIYPSLYGYQSAFMMNRSQLLPSNILGYGESNDSLNPSAIPLFGDVENSVYTSFCSSVEVDGLSVPTGANMTSVQNIRAAFALDKLLRLSNRAKQHVIDQYAARFGVAPKNEGMLESDFLGSFQNDISIGEVLQSVNTDTGGSTNLGAIGGVGRGAAPREKTISGYTDCDCYIIGVAYVIPRVNYDALFVDAFNVKSAPSDFFQPEFENMGLQPVYQYQLRSYASSDGEIDNVAINNSILGYQPRYSEYKISVDENHSIFNPGNELAAFVTHTSRDRNSLTAPDGVTMRYFKVYPQYLNSIFVEQVNEDSYPSTDQFFGTIHFDFDVVQKMSATGEPSL